MNSQYLSKFHFEITTTSHKSRQCRLNFQATRFQFVIQADRLFTHCYGISSRANTVPLLRRAGNAALFRYVCSSDRQILSATELRTMFQKRSNYCSSYILKGDDLISERDVLKDEQSEQILASVYNPTLIGPTRTEGNLPLGYAN